MRDRAAIIISVKPKKLHIEIVSMDRDRVFMAKTFKAEVGDTIRILSNVEGADEWIFNIT